MLLAEIKKKFCSSLYRPLSKFLLAFYKLQDCQKFLKCTHFLFIFFCLKLNLILKTMINIIATLKIYYFFYKKVLILTKFFQLYQDFSNLSLKGPLKRNKKNYGPLKKLSLKLLKTYFFCSLSATPEYLNQYQYITSLYSPPIWPVYCSFPQRLLLMAS